MPISKLVPIVISIFLSACSEKELSLIFDKSTSDSAPTTTLPPRPEQALKQLSINRSHSCALIEDGVKCWGANGHGQVGNNSPLHAKEAEWALPIGSGVKSVVAAWAHTCALTESGAVKCWGRNHSYQIGDGTTTDRAVPTDVAGLSSGVADITGGTSFTCILTTSGGVKCWGLNDVGQLGDGSTVTKSSPVDVVGLTSGVKSIRAGYSFVCAVLTTGAVKCWGENNRGQLGRGNTTSSSSPVDVVGLSSGVDSISTGNYHACVRLDSGAAKCWGYNYAGMVGDGTLSSRSSPVDVVGLSAGVIQIEAGSANSCALLESGTLQCWGYNFWGQLGDGTRVNQSVPNVVPGISDSSGKIVMGYDAICFTNSTGTTNYCWGDNSRNVFGDRLLPSNPLTAVTVLGMSSGTQGLGAPTYYNCGLIAGAVKCWGLNTHGMIGDGTVELRPSPTQVIGLESNVRAIAVSQFFACAITTIDTVKCWGLNSLGQLGDGTTTNRLTPVDVVGITDAQSISLGANHACVLTTTGGIKCWGANTYGQLGDTSTTNRLNPVGVVGLASGVQLVLAGNNHSCALTTTGGVKCWGRNNFGQLGDSTTTTRSSPVDVIGLTSGVTSVSVNTTADHSCALHAAGGIKCWGYNFYGQLGDGSTTNSTSPVDVQTLTSGVASISAGYLHSCAIITGGQAFCWGFNANGQLGDANTYTQSLSPVSMTVVTSGIQTLLAGMYGSCVVTTAGASLCWGNNPAGQIGDGSRSSIFTPTRIRIY